MRTGLLILLLLAALAGCSDPNERNEKGQTPLLLAAEAGDLERVKALIDDGADIHARDHCLFTPLLKAAAGGHYAIAELLLQQGADPDDTDQGLYSAVMFAAGNNHPRLIELLLAHDAHIDLADASLGWSALIWAAREGHVESIAVLLAHGADIALRDTGGNTALLWAVKKGHRGAVRQLLDAGARPEETDGEGNSALAIAARRGDRDILELLVGVVTGPASRLLPEGALFAKVSPIQSRTKEPIMAREIIHTDKAPQAIGTYSQAVKVGSTVYLSGQIPLVPETMELVEGEMEAQIRRVFDNLSAVAEAAGGSLADMAKLNIFLTDLAHFPLVNQVMADYFQQPYPARAAIGVAALPKGAQVEMDGVLELE